MKVICELLNETQYSVIVMNNIITKTVAETLSNIGAAGSRVNTVRLFVRGFKCIASYFSILPYKLPLSLT